MHQYVVQAEQVVIERMFLFVLFLDCVVEILYVALTYLHHVGVWTVPDNMFFVFDRVIT